MTALDQLVEPRHGTAPAMVPPVRVYTVFVIAFVAAAFASRYDAAAAVGVAIGSVLVVHFWLSGRRLRWYGQLVLVNMLFWIAYGWAIGSLPGVDDFVPFISTEGRVLVATVPLLGLAAIEVREAHLRALERTFEVFAVAFAVLLVAFWLRLPIATRASRGNFHGLTSTHHAPAFLAGITLLVLWATRAGRTRWSRWALIAAAFAVIIESNSRAALVGLATAGLFLAMWRPGLARLARTLVGAALVAVCIVAFVPRAGDTVERLFDSDFQEQVSVVYRGGQRQPTGTAEANILRRVSNWSEARTLIASSPLIGIGPWRYDDELDVRTGVDGIAAPVVSGTIVHSDGHTHNVYLQIATETGLVGVLILGSLWAGLAVAVRRADRRPGRPPEIAPWLLASWLGIAYGLGVSLTDIGLINPALAFPLVIVVGTALAYRPSPIGAGRS